MSDCGVWVPFRRTTHSSVILVETCMVGLKNLIMPLGTFTLKKLECSKQARRLNNLAWNNGIGPRFCSVGLRKSEVMIKRDRRGHSYCGARGEILGPSQDELQRKHLPRMFSLIKNES